MDSKKGYWTRAILPELKRERDRNDSQVDLGRYMARRKKDAHRSGAVGDVIAGDLPAVSGTPKPSAFQRKYPAGRRMFKAERMQAMGNTPTTGKGVVK